jgi:uncharacterized protein with NAD-binding domain and iron-sulfur cluster
MVSCLLNLLRRAAPGESQNPQPKLNARKIAILGGGMAGLSAAYHLTRTPELRQQHDVTVYQLGWRLGGKAASGRDKLGRNLEHGLHVWFGCYENTFQLLREVYGQRTPPPGSPLRSWTDVAKPQNYTPVGVLGEDGRWSYYPVTWPMNDGVPGDGTLMPTLMQMIQVLIGWAGELLSGATQPSAEAATRAAGPPPTRTATAGLPPRWGAHTLLHEPTVLSVLEAAHTHALSFGDSPDTHGRDGLLHLTDLLDWSATAFRSTVGKEAAAGSQDHMVRDVLEILKAVVRGVVVDLLIPNRPFEALDDADLRDWLISHRGDPEIVKNSAVIRVVYDTMFQYVDGDVRQPDYAAGAALGVIMRLLGTYKGAMMWDIQAGMGEAVVAPLYEVLCAAGVKFKFFRKVTKLELSPDGRRIQRVLMDRQADTSGAEYRPLMTVGGLSCWPSEPLWTQLKDGDALKRDKVNFESHWCDRRADAEVLQLGTDFDAVVLAICLGAYKKLNNDPGMCDDLIALGGKFADFVNGIGIVPSQGVQLWCDRSTEEMGWNSGKAATVSGPEYLNIWADMSQVLAVEPWEHVTKPRSLHYLTGTYATQLHKEPMANKDTPQRAADEIKRTAIDWLNSSSYNLWRTADPNGQFDWSVLTDPANGAGAARFDAQFWRANIDPTECCTLSAAGTIKYRLLAGDSGFENLILAGEGTRHGFNTTTIEGAVMSGAAASKAICGSPEKIVGYDFMRRLPSDGPG